MALIDRDGDGTAEWMTRQLRNRSRGKDALATRPNAVWRFPTGALGHKLPLTPTASAPITGFSAKAAKRANLPGYAGLVPAAKATAVAKSPGKNTNGPVARAI